MKKFVEKNGVIRPQIEPKPEKQLHTYNWTCPRLTDCINFLKILDEENANFKCMVEIYDRPFYGEYQIIYTHTEELDCAVPC